MTSTNDFALTALRISCEKSVILEVIAKPSVRMVADVSIEVKPVTQNPDKRRILRTCVFEVIGGRKNFLVNENECFRHVSTTSEKNESLIHFARIARDNEVP